MNSKKIVIAALLAAIGAPVLAAGADSDPAPDPRIVTQHSVILQSLDGMRAGLPPIGHHGKPVKGVPYSAEVVSERQQNLADGNQIVNKSTSLSYRDSAGRTRQEMRNAKDEVVTVVISDPVAGAVYTLNPRTRTATKIPTNIGNPEERKAFAEAARARVEQLRKDGKLPVERRREIIIRQGGDDQADGEVRMQLAPGANMHIEAPNMVAERNGDLTVRLGPLAGAMADMKWAGKAVSKDLGTREIEGVKAEGKLRSYEIPAGEMGNRNPIVVSDETWYAPDLQVTVLSKHSDPRAGENVYRLARIRREEPAAALFAPPSDYTIKDRSIVLQHLMEKKAP